MESAEKTGGGNLQLNHVEHRHLRYPAGKVLAFTVLHGHGRADDDGGGGYHRNEDQGNQKVVHHGDLSASIERPPQEYTPE